jgi:chitinase
MRLLIGLALAVSIAVPLASRQPARSALRVVGYYADWTAARYPLATIPADKLTHVNYAFGKIDAANRLTWNADAATGQVYPGDCDGPGCAHGLFNQIAVLKRAHPGLKFLMSVGGWTDSGPFYEMAAADASREVFAASCADFLRTYPQFDGIDIDWEHPVAGGLQPGQPRDAHNYVLLLTALRRAIGADRLLTVAVGAGPRAIDPLEYADMAAPLDFVNVMTYDFHTGGARTGFNAALYNHDDPNPRLNLHEAVQAIVAKGVPRGKVVAGMPFYGRGWSGVESAAPWSTGAATLQVGAFTRIADTFLSNPAYVRHWDDVAKAPWLYNETAKEWITYDDPESMTIKGRYVAEHQLGGAMFWELSNDDGRLLDALRAGLGLPSSR